MQDRCLEKLKKWARSYSVIDSRRLLPTLMVVRAGGHFWTEDQVLAISKLVLWIFAVDDVIDNREISNVSQYVNQLVNVFIDDSCAATNDDLGKIGEEIRSMVLGSPRCATFVDLIVKMMIAMLQERSWSELTNIEKRSLRIDEYLHHARYSIGSPAYLAYCDALGNISKLSQDRVTDLLLSSGLIMRLANDYQTLDREISEQTINLCLIENLNKSDILHLADVAWNGFKEKYARHRNDAFVKLTWNTTLYTLAFYTKFDFHTVSQASLETFFDTIRSDTDYCS